MNFLQQIDNIHRVCYAVHRNTVYVYKEVRDAAQ